jgi:hypothetical protein
VQLSSEAGPTLAFSNVLYSISYSPVAEFGVLAEIVKISSETPTCTDRWLITFLPLMTPALSSSFSSASTYHSCGSLIDTAISSAFASAVTLSRFSSVHLLRTFQPPSFSAVHRLSANIISLSRTLYTSSTLTRLEFTRLFWVDVASLSLCRTSPSV